MNDLVNPMIMSKIYHVTLEQSKRMNRSSELSGLPWLCLSYS
jgi:hypothetical protein